MDKSFVYYEGLAFPMPVISKISSFFLARLVGWIRCLIKLGTLNVSKEVL